MPSLSWRFFWLLLFFLPNQSFASSLPPASPCLFHNSYQSTCFLRHVNPQHLFNSHATSQLNTWRKALPAIFCIPELTDALRQLMLTLTPGHRWLWHCQDLNSRYPNDKICWRLFCCATQEPSSLSFHGDLGPANRYCEEDLNYYFFYITVDGYHLNFPQKTPHPPMPSLTIASQASVMQNQFIVIGNAYSCLLRVVLSI